MDTVNNFSNLRNATEFYPIPLTGKAYNLSKEMLEQATSKNLHKKRSWHYPELRFESLDKGVAVFRNSHGEKGEYLLTLRLEPQTLWVSCSCGEQVETLCLHSFHALAKAIWNNTDDFFLDYIPNGRLETALANPAYFTVEDTFRGLSAFRKKGLGTVYGFSNQEISQRFPHAGSFLGTAAAPPPRPDGNILAYMLAKPHRKGILPFLLPCLGTPVRDGSQIKYFQQFLSGASIADSPYLSEEQKTLNRLCLDIYKLAESLPGTLGAIDSGNTEQLGFLFRMWQEAFALLRHQPFTYSFRFFQKRALKQKPEKNYCGFIRPSDKRPELRFRLLDRSNLFQLKLSFFISGTEIKDPVMDTLFFVQDNFDFYILASLRDAALAEWITAYGNTVTIFKNHYPSFEQEILAPLRENYRVETITAPKLKLDDDNRLKKKKAIKCRAQILIFHNVFILPTMEQTSPINNNPPFNEDEWIRLVFLLSDTSIWLDTLICDAFRQPPISNRKKLFKSNYHLSVKTMAHIIERHYHKIPRHPGTGKFTVPLVDVLALIRDASQTEPFQVGGSENLQRVFEAGHMIGFDRNGIAASCITVITDISGDIVTAFPESIHN